MSEPSRGAGSRPVPERDGELGRMLVANMSRMTMDRIGRTGLDNARRNLSHLGRGQSLRALRNFGRERGDHALVLGAGPSLHRRKVADQLRARPYHGTLIVTDSCMSYCLRNGLLPDLVVTLDPHATRIVRWFGDPKLAAEDMARDDYHRRQDMDPAFADEVRANAQMIALLDEHGPRMRIALSTSASEAVVDRVLQTGMDIYWWNPMYDDPGLPGSLTMELRRLNGLPCVNAGGNVGAACWMIAHAVLGKRRVGLAGMDFSYYEDTPYRNTQYYREALELVGGDEGALDAIYMRVFNPHLEAWFYTDPAYMWYRECFLDMARDADCTTVNCTEGGILFGEPVRVEPLSDFLDELAGDRAGDPT